MANNYPDLDWVTWRYNMMRQILFQENRGRSLISIPYRQYDHYLDIIDQWIARDGNDVLYIKNKELFPENCKDGEVPIIRLAFYKRVNNIDF
jgi:hypothetical protein